MTNDFLTISNLRKNWYKQKQEAYQRDSRNRLRNNASKKVRTTFIGAIDSFEKKFGEIWGHNKDITLLTEEQKIWREVWEEVRKEVLDKGNNQLRALCMEIDDYQVEWDKNFTNLPVFKKEYEK